MLAFEAIIKIHQAQYYNKPETPRPPLGIVFSSVKRENADDGLVSCAKYFCNYAFYKFGLQVCRHDNLLVYLNVLLSQYYILEFGNICLQLSM